MIGCQTLIIAAIALAQPGEQPTQPVTEETPTAEVQAESEQANPAVEKETTAQSDATATASTAPSYAWGGSSLTYRNTVTLPSFFKNYYGYENPVDPSQCDGNCGWWNPYYAMSLTMSPSWVLTDSIALSGRFTLSGELTQSDAYAAGYPVQWSDVDLTASFGNLYTIPVLDVGISASTTVSVGTSQVSQAATKVGSAGAGVSLSRSFKVLGGLSFGMNVTGTGNFYTSSQGAVSQSLQRSCTAGSIASPTSECSDLLLGGGSRNVLGKLSNSYSAGLKVTDWLSLAGNVGLSWGFLDSVKSAGDESFTIDNPASTRYYISSGLSASVALPQVPYLTIVLGEVMSHRQRGLDGEYISFRRVLDSTTFYLDLRFNLGSFVAAL